MDERKLKDPNAVIAGRVRGYASVFGVLDDYNTIFDQGCFADWLDENRGQIVPVFYWHNNWGVIPVGRAVAGESVTEDERGLLYEAEILDTPKGRDLLKGVAARAVNKTSISFVVQDRYQRDEIWHFRRVKLIEVSPLVFAGNQYTTCELVEAPFLADSDPSETPRGAAPDVVKLFATKLDALAKELRHVR